MHRIFFTPLVSLAFIASLGTVSAQPPATQPNAPPKAARSVHLAYPSAESVAFYNEAAVEQSVAGSYFMCCGFTRGYFGIQDHGDHKNVIFSVWDPAKGNNASAVPADQRVEILYKADDVVAKRFGGEGTGAQSFLPYDWKVGQTYRFLVKADGADQKTAYAAYFWLPDKNAWKHLVTFRTAGGAGLTGLYSFVEDFRRDTKSAGEVRRAAFGNGWVLDAKGQWHTLLKARFTASHATWEAKQTINAGLTAAGFFLQTGGETKAAAPLGSTLERPAGDAKPPELPTD